MLIAAGYEPTGRVGLLADVATVTGLGVAAAAVATAITAQGTGCARVDATRPALLRAQVEASLQLRSSAPAVVKIGLLPDGRALLALRRALRDVQAEWILDPVARSSTGAALSTLSPKDYLALASAHVVLTPNAVEAGWLLGRPPVTSPRGAQEAAEQLLAHGFGAVILKGGHLRGAASADLLVTSGGARWLAGSRLSRTRAHRGTGCRFASALAAQRAMGVDLLSAARNAKAFVREFIAIVGPSSR